MPDYPQLTSQTATLQKRGCEGEEALAAPPPAASVPFMCSGKQRGGWTRSLPVNFARADDHHLRRSGEGPGPQ